MILKFNREQNMDYVYITMHNDELRISDFYICDYESFFSKYNKNGILDLETLTDDLIDTLTNMMSIPYNKEEIKENLYVGVNSVSFKHLQL